MLANNASSEMPVSMFSNGQVVAGMELIRLLQLTIAELAVSMDDGSKSVSALGDSITSVANGLHIIQALVTQLPETTDQEIRLTMEEQCLKTMENVRTIVKAMQFYDRLTQRLVHASNNLSSIAEVIGKPLWLIDESRWLILRQEIRSEYTIETERIMFDIIMNGVPAEQALKMVEQHSIHQDMDNIELF
jgi:hypothetical protein